MLLPVLVLIAFGVIDFGRLFYAYTTIANAAHQGAVCASVGTGLCPGGAAGAASAEIGTSLPGGITTAVTGGAGSGSSLTVTVTHNFQSLTTTIVSLPMIPVRASATVVVP